MSYVLSRPVPTRRFATLGIVIGLHAGIVLLVLAAKTLAPQIVELPLIVDLIQPAAETRPTPVQTQPAIKSPVPVKKAAPSQPTPIPIATASNSEISTPAAAQPAPTISPTAPTPVAAAMPVSQARFDADYLRNPAPAYPPLARRLGEQGKVVLRVAVTPEGTVDDLEIKISSGSSRLDEAALRTVRNWKFIPAKRGETPVHSWVLVPISFKLEQ